jgi:uncharacterized protein (DUF58 family)
MTSGRLAPAPQAAHAKASARLGVALTPRGLLLLGVGLIWFVPSLIDRRALFMMAGWDALILLLVALELMRLPAPEQWRVTRTWGGPLSIGAPATITLRFQNDGRYASAVRAADYVAPPLRGELAVLQQDVPAGGEAEVSFEVLPRERGDVAVGDVALTWTGAWHLAERWGVVPLAQTVRVYPDLTEGRAEALYLIRSRQITLEKRRTKFAGSGREFESLRDYRDGDEQRDVCWPVSARRGKLVTKVYQPERSQAVWVLVDAGRLLRARVGDRTMLDASVTAALTLAQVALGSGDRVGLLAYGRRLQHRLAPARGAGHLRTVVEALATVKADGVDADHAGAVATLLAAQKRRALIVWLTEIAETAGVPDVIEQAMTMASRHVVLFAVMRQPEMQELADRAPSSTSEMYRVAAAQETLDRREALLRGLRQRGALVLEVSPAELSAGVVDRYLETRERGLL